MSVEGWIKIGLVLALSIVLIRVFLAYLDRLALKPSNETLLTATRPGPSEPFRSRAGWQQGRTFATYPLCEVAFDGTRLRIRHPGVVDALRTTEQAGQAPREMRVPTDILRAVRAGPAIQLGIKLYMRGGGQITLWGPALPRLWTRLGDCGVPISRSQRRVLWRLH